jgi:hypothetical protein
VKKLVDQQHTLDAGQNKWLFSVGMTGRRIADLFGADVAAFYFDYYTLCLAAGVVDENHCSVDSLVRAFFAFLARSRTALRTSFYQ